MKIVVDKLPEDRLECPFCYIKEGNLFCKLDDETCNEDIDCPYVIDLVNAKSSPKTVIRMTPERFKEEAQKIYDSGKGYAGEDGHLDMDQLMKECLDSLGYQEGTEILFSMKSIWYS